MAGVAGVLAFPTHSTHLTIPSTKTSSSGTSPTTAPATATSPSTAASGSSATRSATSTNQQFPFGAMAVKVTVSGSKIVNVTMATLSETDGRSASIDSYAIPQLEQQVIAAGSVNINGVSGATFTSQAFVDAVANALQQLGISP